MAPHMLKVFQSARELNISGNSEMSLLDNLRDAGITGIHAPCGGKGSCKQCTITVTGKVRAVSSGEITQADGIKLLSCCYAPEGDCELILPENKKMNVLTRGVGDIVPCGTGLGIAVDIGTTTVAVYLYDLQTGSRLSVQSDRNAQRPYGADVISRIQFCSDPDGLGKLSRAITGQISDAIDACCAEAKRSRRDIMRIAIAGNTVMQHILMRLSPVSIGVAPFKTLSLFGDTVSACDIFSGLADSAELYLCPALAGYVGGDITAGLLFSGAYESESECLFLDIGTNGEMGIGNKDGFTCCATAAGPAFEGAEIECGMDGSEGAISEVRLIDGELELGVIGDVEATGICGSGLVDALCTMLRCGAIQENGRMSTPSEVSENIGRRLRPDENGRMRFYLTNKVYVSGDDVRQLQMAKSAIRAGIETLLAVRKIKYDDLRHVIIAGGFGAYMDVGSACGIGLLPPAFLNKTHHAGNTAGGGAALSLGPVACKTLSEISSKCEYLELSGSPIFMEKYIECMIFDEVEEVF